MMAVQIKRWVVLTGAVTSLCITSLFAQQMGFPQHVQFDKCLRPGGVTTGGMDSAVSVDFKSWRDKYVGTAKSTPGGYYVRAKGTGSATTITVSEAHGYGMIIMALMAGSSPLAEAKAQEYFDGMYKFFRAHPSETDLDLMSWQIDTNSSGQEIFKKQSTATDGDLDIAYSLILAHYQWGSTGTIKYLDEAKKVIAAIKRRDMNLTNKRVMLGDFGEWGNPSHPYYTASRPSDWMYSHYRIFKEVSGDIFWNDVADTAYSVYKQFIAKNSPNTGLISDFLKGTPPVPMKYGDDDNTLQYDYNACRVPWRLAVDYAHYTTPQAKEISNKMVDWIIDLTGGGWPSKIMDGYALDGTATGTYNSPAFVAPLVAACIVDKSATNKDYPAFLARGWKKLISEIDGYYEDSINLLCMMLISGNWWRPGTISSVIRKSYKGCFGKYLSIQETAGSKSFYIRYVLSKNSAVSLGIYDIRGRIISQLINGNQPSGSHTISVNRTALATGMYLVKFINSPVSETRAFTIID